MDFLEMNELVQALDLEAIVDQAIIDNEAYIVDAVHAQLKRGEDEDGDKISSFTSQYADTGYAEMKYKMNSAAGFGNVDLKLTGDWYSGMALEKQDDAFVINSSDEKNDDLKKRYGESITGIQEQSAGEVAQDYLYEDIMDAVRDQLGV